VEMNTLLPVPVLADSQESEKANRVLDAVAGIYHRRSAREHNYPVRAEGQRESRGGQLQFWVSGGSRSIPIRG
jgi:hypothetical protein